MLVLVKENGVVVSKEVYAGDTTSVEIKLNERKNKNNLLTFEFFDESDVKEFEAIELVSKDQTEWQMTKGKGTEATISFLAKRLGLE